MNTQKLIQLACETKPSSKNPANKIEAFKAAVIVRAAIRQQQEARV